MVNSTSTKQHLQGREDSKRHVIFLDIDGVLQPCWSQKRFNYDLEQTRAEIADKMNNDDYLKLDKYDVGAVYYDWKETAVKNLKQLLRQCDAEIVISSDWKRSKTLEELKLLFRIHGLDEYVTDMTWYTSHTFKPEEIKEYLGRHPNLDSYVVLDDLDMEKHFRGHTVYTAEASFLTTDSMRKAARILEFGPWWENKYEKMTSDDMVRGTDLIEDHYKKVVFLDIDGVLNGDGKRRDEDGIIIDSRFVKNLKYIIEETDAEIILTSSWRNRYRKYAYGGFAGEDTGVQMLLEYFDRHKLRIPGITSCYFNGSEGRPQEIRSWLCHRPKVEKFVILDDETSWNWSWLKPYVICTAKEKDGFRGPYIRKGLDEELAKRAIELLNE